MQIAQVLGGYSLGQADLLRRAMGKKKADEMAKQREAFLAGCRQRRVDEAIANDLFDKMTKFSEYCFNRAHTAAYAVVTYHTAYLKAHYPSEYMAALMSSLLGSQDKILLCINDCKRMSIPVLPPDVNTSGADFTPTDEGIRFGLGAIKNVGLGAIEAIVEARRRQEGGRFKDFYRFCAEVDLKAVNKRCIESLIRAGALDTLGAHRAQMLAALDDACERAARKQRDDAIGQISLFGAATGVQVELESPVLPEVPLFDPEEQLAMEKELMGFYVSGHPLHTVPVRLEWHTTHTISQLEGLLDTKGPAEPKGEGKSWREPDSRPVVVGGLLVQTRRNVTKQGKMMLVGKLEDFTGQIDVVAFSETLENHSTLLHEDAKLLIKGKYSNRDERPQIVISQAYPLGAMASLHLHLSENTTPQQLVSLAQLLRGHPGEAPVILHFDGQSRQVLVGSGFWVGRVPGLDQTLETLLGADRVEWYDPQPQLSLV